MSQQALALSNAPHVNMCMPCNGSGRQESSCSDHNKNSLWNHCNKDDKYAQLATFTSFVFVIQLQLVQTACFQGHFLYNGSF